MSARPHRPPQLRVQGFYGVRGVDDPSHREGEGEERDDLLPASPPALRDRRVFLAGRGASPSVRGCATLISSIARAGFAAYIALTFQSGLSLRTDH
jgi:hypothetical protein